MQDTQSKNKNIGPFLAFNEAYFTRHQKKLLFLLNAPIVKILFRKILHIDIKISDKVKEIGPNRYTIDAGLQPFKYSGLLKTFIENCDAEKKVIKAKKLLLQIEQGILDDIEVILPAQTTDFRAHNKYAKRLYHAFKPIWWAMHYWDELVADKRAPALSFGFSTLTAYPSPGTTVDGYVSRSNVVESWSTIRAGAGTNNDSSQTEVELRIASEWNSSPNFAHLYRFIALFDTSALGSGATISAATLSLNGTNKSNTFSHTSFEYNIYTSNPASNTALANADFTTLGTTKQSDTNITYTGWSTTGYNDFAFNATGIGNISKTGISKFGAREALYDAAGASLTYENDKIIRVYFNASDASGTSTDPKLVITYTTVNNYTQNLTETITLVETRLNTTSKPFTEVVALVEVLAKQPAKIFTEVITLVETQIKTTGKAIVEAITLSEVFSRLQTAFRSLTETITLVDTVDPNKIAVVALVENISLVDAYQNVSGKVLTETITLVETFTKGLTAFRAFTETITLVDTMAILRTYFQTLTETITLVETAIKSTAKSFVETIALNEVMQTAKVYARAFVEVITLVDTTNSGRTKYQVLTETITLVDSMRRVTSKILTETLSLTQRFLGMLNGKDISYRSKYENRSGEYRKKYLDF